MSATDSKLPDVLRRFEPEIFAEWLKQQMAAVARSGAIKESELREQSRDFLHDLQQATQSGIEQIHAAQWDGVRDRLTEIAQSRAQLGFKPSETALFVLSLKSPLFSVLGREYAGDPQGLVREIWTTTQLLDQLALLSIEAYQKGREAVIARQQQELLELSTPVVRLWDNVLALPLIGTLDSARTQVVMENLLEEIVKTGAGIAIMDITGVPAVDTLVAQHLLKTVAAARLMGADCIISGIRPQIAQTIVHLGVELGGVITKASLADAFRIALQKNGLRVVRAEHAAERKAWSESQS